MVIPDTRIALISSGNHGLTQFSIGFYIKQYQVTAIVLFTDQQINDFICLAISQKTIFSIIFTIESNVKIVAVHLKCRCRCKCRQS